MTTRAILTTDGGTYDARPPYESARHAIVCGLDACPSCAAAPYAVRGTHPRISADDRHWESDAICIGCGAAAGVLSVAQSTMFGMREDRAVLEGRPRVY